MIAEDLAQYKFVIFDFDDTLYIHKEHILGLTEEEQLPYDISMLKGEAETDDEPGEKSELLEVFIGLCKDRDCKIGLCSSTLSYKHMVAKERWVKNNYKYTSEIENFCVGKTEDKIRMLKTIAKTYNIELNQILFVDDDWCSLAKARYLGTDSACPLEAINYVLKHNKEEK